MTSLHTELEALLVLACWQNYICCLPWTCVCHIGLLCLSFYWDIILYSALVGVTGEDGKSIFAGRKATAFSNTEEEQVKAVETIPFLVESKIKELGGTYEKAAEPWGVSVVFGLYSSPVLTMFLQVKVIVDGHLITGQNPASAGPIGEAIRKALKLWRYCT